ncbi:SpoIIE family protein phosphatase [Candidatus Saccharibacteria bacterium]|nr:SpoIIE family protein phosphatase [Candidatus Saccharibacteria bacterium]
MGFLGFGNRNKVKQSAEANPAANAWNMDDVRGFDPQAAAAARAAEMGAMRKSGADARMMNDVRGQSVEQNDIGEYAGENQEAKLNAERQQRKIIAALCQGGGRVDKGIIWMRDVSLPNGAEERVLSMIRSGEIGEREERQLISEIMDPVTKYGKEAVMQRITDKHELRLLGGMTKGDEGFYGYQELTSDDLAGFREKYPSPIDFDGEGEAFIGLLTSSNGNHEQKRAEYKQALDSLGRKVYGKQYEYWLQMRDLNERAGVGRNDGVDERAEVRRAGDVNMQERAGDVNMRERAGGVNMQERASGVNMRERERSAEWMPGAAGMWQVSRAQVTRGYVTPDMLRSGLWADGSCEDSMLSMPGQQTYGVYDGAGGVQGGRTASQVAAGATEALCQRYLLRDGRDLAWVLNEANKAVVNEPNAGITTAVLTKVVEKDGRKQLAWASAGDSRIYIVNKYGQVHMVTKDEGEGKYIYNALGRETENGESRVQQFGDEELYPGDRVVLCSDGITGDYGTDLMSDAELGSLVMNARDAREAAKNLVSGARKRDDRTAVVFGV